MTTSTQLTNEQVIEHYNKLVEIYGDKLPSFEHEPLQFEYIVKLYKYYNMETKSE